MAVLGAAISLTRAQDAPAPPPVAETGAGHEYSGVKTSEAQPAEPPDRILPATLVVSPDKVVGPLQRKLFGLNFDRWGMEEGVVIDGRIDPESARLMEGVPLPLNRVAGCDALRFQWKNALGPYQDRPRQQLWSWAKNIKIAIGPVEWVQWLREIDPSAEVAWVLNIVQDSPEDHADLVSFLTGQEGRVDQNGVDWAKRRRELGLEKPVRVAIWEIGNEMDWDGDLKWSVARYIEEARKAIEAVRSVDPQAKIAVHAFTAPWANVDREFKGARWAGWHRAVLKALGPQIDYVAFHPYYLGLPMSEIETYLDRIRDDIVHITGENRIRVYLSEHARWPEMPKSGKWDENYYLTNCLEGALATGQFLVRCMNRPEITAATYHSFLAGPWAVLRRDKDSGSLYPSAIADLFRVFGKLPGGEVVKVDVEGPATDVTKPDANFAAAAVKSSTGLSLVVVNRGPAREVGVNLPGNYTQGRGWLLTGPEPDSKNTPTERPVKMVDLTVEQTGGPFQKLTLPAFSMVVVDLVPGMPTAGR